MHLLNVEFSGISTLLNSAYQPPRGAAWAIEENKHIAKIIFRIFLSFYRLNYFRHRSTKLRLPSRATSRKVRSSSQAGSRRLIRKRTTEEFRRTRRGTRDDRPRILGRIF